MYENIPGPCEPNTCTVYNYKGKVLAHQDDFDKDMRQKYNSPFADCHRVDLQHALVRRAEEFGVEVVLNARVVKLDFEHDGKRAAVCTSSNHSYTADLVVGADGLWSMCRCMFLGRMDPPLPTGDLAFRIVLMIEQIKDPKLREMVQMPAVRFWVGPDSHVVAYSLRGGTMYNVVLLVPDDLPEEVARMEGNLEEMKKLFEGWDPVYVFSFFFDQAWHADHRQLNSTPLLRLQSRQMETHAPRTTPILGKHPKQPRSNRRFLPSYATLPCSRRKLLHRRRRRARPPSFASTLYLSQPTPIYARAVSGAKESQGRSHCSGDIQAKIRLPLEGWAGARREG